MYTIFSKFENQTLNKYSMNPLFIFFFNQYQELHMRNLVFSFHAQKRSKILNVYQ